MTGEWVRREVDKHTCARPGWDRDVRRGDIWRCGECGQHWMVEVIEHGMQWDPIDPPALKWRKYEPPRPVSGWGDR